MKCPKSYLLSTVIYLEKLVENGYLPNNPEIKKNIAGLIAGDYIKYLKEYAKFEKKNSESVKQTEIGLDMVSKSVLYSINFNSKAKPKNELISKKNEYTMPFDVIVKPEFISRKYYENSDGINENPEEIQTESEKKEFKKVQGYTFYNESDKIVFLSNIDLMSGIIEYFNIEDAELIDKINSYIEDNMKNFNESFIEIDDFELPFYYIDTKLLSDFFQKNGICDEIDGKKLNAYLTDVFMEKLQKSLNSFSKHEKFAVLPSIGVHKYLLSQSQKPLKIKLNVLNNEIVLPSLAYSSKKERYKEQGVYKFYNEFLNDDEPHKSYLTLISPKQIELNINLSKKIIDLKLLEFKEDVKPLMKNNTAMNKKFFYPEQILDEITNIVVDEADKGVSGNIADIFRKAAQGKNKNVAIATGSPIAGYGKDLVYLMGYSGELSGDAINTNAANFNKLVGVYEITLKEFAKILPFIKYKEINNMLKEIYKEYLIAVSNKEGERAFNPKEFFSNAAVNFLNSLLSFGEKNENKIDTRGIYSIEGEKFKKELERVITLFAKNKYSSSASFEENFLKLSTVSTSGIFKLIPSILNPKTMTGLVNMNSSASASIMSREILKDRKEVMNFLDYDDFLETYKKPDEIDFQKIDEHNILGVRLYYSSAMFYSGSNFLNQIYFHSLNNFNLFVKSLYSQLKKVASIFKMAGYDYTGNDVKNFLSKSTVSGKDTMYNLYKTYIDTNGDFNEVKKLLNKDNADEKLDFFEIILKLYDKFMNNIQSISDSGILNIKNENSSVKIKINEVNYAESFKNIFGNEMPIEALEYKNGYPYTAGNKIDFTFNIDLCVKDEWKKLLSPNKEKEYIPYSFRITNRAEEDVFDVLGSKGIAVNIKETIEKDSQKGFVISSARTAGVMFNLLDTLCQLIVARKEDKFDKNKKINVIFNVPSSNDIDAKDILSRVDYKLLQKYNIELTPISRTSLDAQLRSSVNKKYYTVVVSNYESVSRGLDLSDLSVIIATGKMTKGKEFIQFLSRLFSVNKDNADIYMCHGGYDVGVMPRTKDDVEFIAGIFNPDLQEFVKNVKINEDNINEFKETCMFYLTSTGKQAKKAFDKMMTYKFFMSGERTGMIQPQLSITPVSLKETEKNKPQNNNNNEIKQ